MKRPSISCHIFAAPQHKFSLIVTESPHQCKQFPAFAAALKAPNSQMFVFPMIANPAACFPHFGTELNQSIVQTAEVSIAVPLFKGQPLLANCSEQLSTSRLIPI